jgi:uncharacterized membrane protein YvbJ
MPLITCPDCGKEISTAANTCPNCGRPTETATADMNEEGQDALAKKIAQANWQNEIMKTKIEAQSQFFMAGLYLAIIVLIVLAFMALMLFSK